MNRYEIEIDRIAFNDDLAHIRALDNFAAPTGATFENITVTDDSSAITVTLAFDATPFDALRYIEYYDAPSSTITLA